MRFGPCLLLAVSCAVLLLTWTHASVLDRDSFLVTGMSEELVEQANELASKGDITTAVDEWKKALVIYPFNDKAKNALLRYAVELQGMDKDTEAIDILVFIQSTAKFYELEVLFNLASSYQRIGQIEEAANWYRKVLEHDPGHGSSRINLAALHHSHGSIEKAVNQYRLGLIHLGPYLHQQRLLSHKKEIEIKQREMEKEMEKEERREEQEGREGETQEEEDEEEEKEREKWQPTYILELEVMLRSNMAAGYIQLGKFKEARQLLSYLLNDLLQVQSFVCMDVNIDVGVDSNKSSSPAPTLYAFMRENLENLQLFSTSTSTSESNEGKNENESITQLDYTGMGLHLVPKEDILPSRIFVPSSAQLSSCSTLQASIQGVVSHLLNTARATCDWRHREELEHSLISSGALLPFDSLLVPGLSLETIKTIAETYCSQKYSAPANANANAPTNDNANTDSTTISIGIESSTNTTDTENVVTEYKEHNQANQRQGQRQRQVRALRLGFLSYDFNDHPTTHLVEGLFAAIRAGQLRGEVLYEGVELFVYSYGKDDESEYRRRVIELAHLFRDVVTMSYFEVATAIRADGVDVLFDMQVHTMGNRLQVLALRPAPIQVNYLVYPGTSGTSFLDYIVVDPIVAPPEHAQHYSEALLSMPASYQISYYDKLDSSPLQSQLRAAAQVSNSYANDISISNSISTHLSRTIDRIENFARMRQELRGSNGLPEDLSAIVLCNFNKLDKIDLGTIQVWMNILKRFPSSYLWLLEPVKEENMKIGTNPDQVDTDQQGRLAKKNLLSIAVAAGVSERRILFADRVHKRIHVSRQLAADLFIDSFAYGAHSTATDALRGGLPVLTISGSTFANRVGDSLYASLNLNDRQRQRQKSNYIDTDIDNSSMDTIESMDGIDVHRLFVRQNLRDFEDAACMLMENPSLLRRAQSYLAKSVEKKIGIFSHETGTSKLVHAASALVEIKEMKATNIPIDNDKEEIILPMHLITT